MAAPAHARPGKAVLTHSSLLRAIHKRQLPTPVEACELVHVLSRSKTRLTSVLALAALVLEWLAAVLQGLVVSTQLSKLNRTGLPHLLAAQLISPTEPPPALRTG
jgi:hypothetical protein